jgi:hypothetical protein
MRAQPVTSGERAQGTEQVMSRRWVRFGLPAAVIVAVALIALGRGDVVAALLLGGLIMATGRAVFRGYSTTKGPTGPPVDVAEEGTLLVFACETCGEQLVLLRKGTDVPPRHCAEKMVLRRIPTPSSNPDPRFN